MVHRAPSTATEDSLKENSGAPVRSQRVKTEKAANNKGKSRAARVETEDEEEDATQQTRSDEHDNGDDAAEGDEDDADGEGSPKGRKRARVNTQGDARPFGREAKGKAKEEQKTLPRDEDGYVPGSITRVQLRNFVTYDYVEFRPGPYLNMILGPNGTGKSSIACALCLGLNFPPSVLGRAAEIYSFVKLGKDDGHIEIELKGRKGEDNLVIKRELKAGSKASTFSLNGKPATGNEIKVRMQELNVQVTNLCSFLPQDKVAQFAAMTRPQLLRETQRAAGNANLTNWHDTLIDDGREFKSVNEKLESHRKTLKHEEERSADLERDVKRFEERRKMELEVEWLDLLVPYREYEDIRVIWAATKEERARLAEEIRTLARSREPIAKYKEEMEEKLKSLKRQRDDLNKSSQDKFKKMRNKYLAGEALEAEIDTYKSKLDNMRKAEKDRQRAIDNLKEKIAKLEEKVNHPPDADNLPGLIEQQRAKKMELAAVRDRVAALQSEQADVLDQEGKLSAKIEENRRKLRQLDDADHRKLQSLINWDRDCGDTVTWLRANRNRFKMEVFEPPLLSVTVPDQAFSASVEACFGTNDLKTFVTQCEEDYQLLNRMVADTPEALGRRARINTWYRARPQNQTPQPPVSREEVRRLGFDGYAMDFIKHPEGMDWFLQNVVGLHRTAIALDKRRVNPERATEELSRHGGAVFIIGNVMNQVRRSKYGQRLAQNTTREIGPARNLGAATVDAEVKRPFEQAVNEAQQRLELCRAEITRLSAKEAEIRSQNEQVKRELTEIDRQKTAITDAQAAHESRVWALKTSRDDLQRKENAPPPGEERRDLRTKILKLTKKRAEIVNACLLIMRDAIKEQVQSTQLGLQNVRLTSQKAAMDDLFRETEDAWNRANERYKRADAAYKAAKAGATEKVHLSRAKLESISDETRQRYTEFEAAGAWANEPRSAQELEADRDATQLELDMNANNNAGVVEHYKQRQAEIARLSQVIEEEENRLGKISQRIERTKALWFPALSELVQSIGNSFSAAFDRIGCAGEVKIAEHEDYDKWAIEIYVKFRDNEKLSLLTAERQSGGERSLTTILYLMSLTAECRAPFSLVDEINQGMDQQYERTVHNSLVDVTCKSDAGQYFLITPKLLPNLDYHERMKVLCVNNGEWLPEGDGVSGNMMAMIDSYVQSRGAGSSAA